MRPPNSFWETDMAIELTMPALSPTMEKGTLAKWLVAEGDLVKAGDLIAEIETDKATMEYEAVADGRIAKLVVTEGTDDVVVGSVIALLTGMDEVRPLPTSAAEMSDSVTPDPVYEEEESRSEAPNVAAAPPPTPQNPDRSLRNSPAGRLKASPLAARVAEAKGIDLSAIVGSGPNGRIVRRDLGIAPLISTPSALSFPMAAVGPVIAPPPVGVPLETVKLTSMRKTIARRLGESKQNVPHFYLTARCNLDPLLKLRAELNETLSESGVKLSVNDMLIKALALALVAVPDANVQFGGDVLRRFARVDVSIAVAIDGGLVTPVLRDVGSLSLGAIASKS
jgi:pyruvate dehydrogenase E2 component (dihydrolipoamide acetyltransferase)